MISVIPTALQKASVARSLLAPAGGHYIQQMVCDWDESLQIDLWKQAWSVVADRHEVLRAGFQWHDSVDLALHFADAVAMRMEVIRQESSHADRHRALSSFLNADRTRGFDLAAAPLWRVTVFPWNDRETTTVWTFHHSLLDGRSHALIWQEVNAVYRGLLQGTVPQLPQARPFHEFATWLAATSTESAEAYWRERLRGFQTGSDLPTLSSSLDSGEDSLPPAVENVTVSADMTARLRDAAQRHNVTLNNLVQGAWTLALARYQAAEDIVFGVVRSCRHWTKDDPNGRVGMFINTIPFRVDAAPTQRLDDWLRALRTQQLAARAGEFASAEQIRRWCGLSRSTTLFHTCVMFEDYDPSELLNIATQRVRLIEKTDLSTLAIYAGKAMSLTMDYSPRRHPAAQVQAILRHLTTLLEAIADAPGDRPIGELNMLTQEDRRLIFDAWQGPLTDTPALPLHRVLEAQAAQTPQAPAVEFCGQMLTYEDLHTQANRLARRLLQSCKPGDRVAVVLDRAIEQPVAWLAALKAGLVYAPIDPANPVQRLEFCLQDIQPAVVLTQTALLGHLPIGKLRVLCLDAPSEQIAQASLDGGHLDFDPRPDALANLLYTSGSTGQPKAAINGRGGLDNFALHVRRTFGIGPGDRVLQSSSTSFDASLFDLASALQSGATVVLVTTDQLRPGPDLTRTLVEQRISATVLTPTTLRLTPPPPTPAVRVLISGGEPLTADLVRRWSAPGRHVFNVCGPTECSVWFYCDECLPDGSRPTIGRLIDNCRGYVLDGNLQPVPVGVPGELYLGGAGVGLGYWNRTDLTAQRYLRDPFANAPGTMMYRTGDWVRWLADGRLDHLGRVDSQVKVQGVRVELGEIESALRRYPDVVDAAVALQDGQLLAWLIPRGLTPADVLLRAWLADHIPQIFTPSEFHAVAQFPRTRTGKVDRTALLAARLATAPDPRKLSSPQLTARERRQVLEEWNQTARPFPLDRSVLEFFHEQVITRPEAPALKAGARTISYTTLNCRANRIARQLLRAGLQPEDIVALRFGRSAAFVVSALAVLKAGGAYLPLDAQIPAARQNFVLKDSGARFALFAREYLATFTNWPGWSASVDDDDVTSDNASELNPAVPGNTRHRAYVIYTSGSTGQPKGVEIEHRSLTNLVCFYKERLQLTPSDRTTMLANPAFDASAADFWPILCTGGTALVPDGSLLGDPDELIAWIAEERATFSFVPTAIGQLLFTRPWPKETALRYLCVGGEALGVYPPAGLPFTVVNSYGPTENTVDATWEVVSPATSGVTSPPGIGRPISNVRAYVLDDQLDPVPTGVEGELFLGGAQVARGYLNRPELTTQRFLPDPFADTAGARMYRTGDRVVWRPDGSLEFRGRNDDQVQVRGQRVELGEIEATLRQHPEVREVCCRPLFDAGPKRTAHVADAVVGVVAHVVLPGSDDRTIADQLREFVAPRLPESMVPSVFVSHRALPLTVQGKVDRAALDAMAHERTGQAPIPALAVSGDSLVRIISDLWCRILPDGASARTDQTFQELGGDSLRAVKLLLGVEAITGRRLALSTFLLEPTLAGLCRAVIAADKESQNPILALHRGGTRPPLFCLYQVDGDVGAYLELAGELGTDQPVFGIRSPALHDLERTPESIETAACEARKLLQEFAPEGPFALVGFSWAGLLAFEMANQYACEEGFNPFCALFGTYAPLRKPSVAARLVHAGRWLPTWAWRLAQDRGHRRERIRQAMVSARFFRHLVAGEKPVIPPEVTGTLARHLVALAYNYQPVAPRPVPIHLFRERGSFNNEAHPAQFSRTHHLEDGGWQHWTGCSPEIHWLDGKHLTILKRDQIAQTAQELRAALENHFATTPNYPPRRRSANHEVSQTD